MSTKNKVIFFDLFDTLVHGNRGLLEPYFDRETDRLGDNGTLKNSQETIERLASLYPDMLNNFTLDEAVKYYDEQMKSCIINPDKNVLQMLADLKQDGWKLCVISDAARVDIAHWNESPLAQYFDDVVFSCDVGFVKPDQRLFDVAKERMGNPIDCVFCGDGGHEELQGARLANMITAKAEWINNRRVEELYQFSDIRAQSTEMMVELTRKLDFEQMRNSIELEEQMLSDLTNLATGQNIIGDINDILDWMYDNPDILQKAVDCGHIQYEHVASLVERYSGDTKGKHQESEEIEEQNIEPELE